MDLDLPRAGIDKNRECYCTEVVAPPLGEQGREAIIGDSPVEDFATQSKDVSGEELQAPASEQRPASGSEERAGSEVEQPPAFEAEKQPVSEIEQHPASEIVVLPVAPAREVQIPVVVMESREDRLCFPFLWRRASRTTQVQSGRLPFLISQLN